MAPPCSGGPHGDRAPPCFGPRDRAPPCSQAPPCFGSRDRAPPCSQDPHCQQASPCGSSCELQQPPCCSAHDASLCCRQQSSSCEAHSETPSARVSQGDRQQLCSHSTDDCSHAPTGRMAAQWPSAPESPQALLPLREQAGPKELVNIHVPFSLSDLSQTAHKLGSFSVDPQNYIRQFKFITNCYDLRFKDVYVILDTSLISQEWNQLWQAVREKADHRPEFSNHLIKVIGHLIILPALFINQSLHQSPV
ncbi:uncharacterized protein LOC134471470 [Cavia porcellus]|uniref:uncharacterized protein LOC134471470 n=1 Tax=Cavia porcellus TaxID=10141 RepID=UPI002FDF7007